MHACTLGNPKDEKDKLRYIFPKLMENISERATYLAKVMTYEYISVGDYNNTFGFKKKKNLI